MERKTDDAKKLWESFGPESLLSSYHEYQKFLLGKNQATFVRFENLKEFLKPVSSKTWSKIIEKERIPQGGMYINEKIANQILTEGSVKIV